MKRLSTCFVIVALAALAVASQLWVRARRPIATPALAESALAAFGSLRSLVAEVVWFRADRLQDEGRYVELAQLARMLTAAEPHTPEVWSYAAWNLAYNVSVMMPTHEDRWRWIEAAMRLLRDDGLRLNPDSAELHRELAWLFELKLGTDIDAAAGLFRAKWKDRVADVSSRNAWEELSMERSMMDEIERRFGVTERTSPLYSSIYWAYRGWRRATGHERRALAEIIRQSRMIYARRTGGMESAAAVGK